MNVTTKLANALRRVEPYTDLMPASVGRDLREALQAFDAAQAKHAIVQKPGVAGFVQQHACKSCGEKV